MRVPQDTADRWGAVASEKFLPGYCPSRCWPPLPTSRGCRVRTFSLPPPFGFQWLRRRTGSPRHAIGYREIPFLGIPEPRCDGAPSLQRVHGAWEKGGVPFSPEATRGARARLVLWAVHVVQRDTHAGAVRGGIATAKAAGVLGSLCDRLRLRLRPLRVLSAFAVR